MADSQLMCMEEEHINIKISESKPEFYYSEEQRAALEHLLRQGDGAFKLRLREDNIKDFLSAREVKWIRETFQEYDDPEPDPDKDLRAEPRAPFSDQGSDSGVHSTYWPTLSDTEAPALELGWPTGSFYKGVTRVSVYTHPPKESSPHIKEVVRRMIQEAHKTVAVVMDLLTDLLILQDLLDAASKRGVAVYLLLDRKGLPHFLDMCNRLQISAQHLRNICVRMVGGSGLALSFGKLPGSLSSKYMLVDGEKVMFGSYSFTWTSSRLNRNTITVMSGHVVDFFDSDFRELFAVSEKVDLYHEFHVPKPPRHKVPTPVLKAPPANTVPASTSRFQVSLGESQHVNLKVPAHKYHNPKYALVVGNSLGLTGSLQDLSRLRENSRNNSESNTESILHTRGGAEEQPHGAPREDTGECREDLKNSQLSGSKKQRSSFRLFLKGRSPNQSPVLKTPSNNHFSYTPDTKTAKQSQAKPVNQSNDSQKSTNHIRDSPKLNKQSPELTSHTKDSTKTADEVKELQTEEVQIPNGKHTPASSAEEEVDSEVLDELDDSFVVIEKPNVMKFKNKKSIKLPQRSVSMQTIRDTGAEEGSKGQKRLQKKSCIQS